MIFKFTDIYSRFNDDYSSRNYAFIKGQVKEYIRYDWDEIAKGLVEDFYLLQYDADRLVQYWHELLQEKEAEEQEVFRLSQPPKNMSDRLWRLCEGIWNNVMDTTVGEYFQHLVFGCTAFMVVYAMFLADMTNELFRYFFGIAAAVWSSFAFGRKEKGEGELWGVGITCFVLLVGGYWVIKGLAKLF